MKAKIILSLALMVYGLTTTSCEGKKDSCVEEHMDEGLKKSDAEDKCDEDLVETMVVMDELK
jgi:hypothetical protein